MGSQLGALFGGLWGDAGSNFVNLQGGADKVFGTKPQVADFTPINLGTESSLALTENLANYPGITELLNKLVPGFSDMLSQGTSNTLSELKGQLPQDVQDQVLRSSAYKSLVGGYSGTGMASALTARDLGLTSLNLTQMGNNSAQAWTSIAENAYSPWTISTSEHAAATVANNAGQQAHDQFAFNVAAAPDPGAAGIFNVDAALGQQMLSLGMGMAGGAMGGSAGGTAAVAPQQTAANTMYNPGNSGGYTYDPSTGRYVPGTSGGSWQSSATGAWSDARLKTEIIYVGRSPRGFNIVEFEYAGFEGASKIRFRGVIAQEILETIPMAVSYADGFMQVDYSQLDVKLEKVA